MCDINMNRVVAFTTAGVLMSPLIRFGGREVITVYTIGGLMIGTVVSAFAVIRAATITAKVAYAVLTVILYSCFDAVLWL